MVKHFVIYMLLSEPKTTFLFFYSLSARYSPADVCSFSRYSSADVCSFARYSPADVCEVGKIAPLPTAPPLLISEVVVEELRILI